MAMGEALKGGEGQLVALDLPGERIGRLKANLTRLEAVKYSIVEADLNNVTPEYLEAMGLPGCYDVVLLDAPCSNTGVLKRRVDAKWRLEKGEITKMAQLQLKLLKRASALVKKGGRLVYSTCSIEGEENAGVIAEFLKSAGEDFEKLEGKVSYPWMEGCDGGGAFLLHRLG
jgi:16S rRNA (cytosine967-C5)-methyltransferase